MDLKQAIADMKIDTRHMIDGCQRDEANGYNHAIDDVLQTIGFVESVKKRLEEE